MSKDLVEELTEFYVRCPLTRINVMPDMILYKVSGFSDGNKYALEMANQIIKEHNLNLKAEIDGVGLLKNILRISAK